MNEIWAFDPYEILGVRRGSSDRTIAAAHRALARQFHPDIAGDGATVRMMRINAAFDAIRTAERRAAFDDMSASWARSPGGSSATSATGGAGGDSSTTGAAPAPTSGPEPDPSAPDRSYHARVSERDGTGGAGAPPGRPSGSVLDFGRHIGWSIGEIARVDPGYLEWLAGRREGARYVDEIDATLKRVGFRPDPTAQTMNTGRLGFRRR